MTNIKLWSVAALLPCLCMVMEVMTDSLSGAVCGGNITETSGKLVSPDYPYDVPANTSCTWQFAVNHTEKHSWVYLYFTDFVLPIGDVLKIVDGNVSRTFTGTRGPFLILLTPDSTVSYMASPNASLPRRFLAKYNAKECRYFLQGNEKLIQSPVDLPKVEDSQIDCTWTMIPDHGPNPLVLSFLSFKMSEGSWVCVFDGPDTQATKLGNFTASSSLPQDLISSSHLTVSLHLDLAVVSDTFSAQVTETTEACTKTLTVDEDLILQSPMPLHEMVYCVWILQCKPNTTFSVQVDQFNFNSVGDSLLVSDGPSRYSPPLQILTYGANKPRNNSVSSQSNQLYVSFYSEQTMLESNFSLHLKVQTLGGRFYNEGKFALLPNMTHGNESVVFDLIVPSDEQVEVILIDATTNLSKSNQILFYDVQHDDQPIANFTSLTPFYPVFTSGSHMRVEAKDFHGSSEFSAEFTTISKGCNDFSKTNVGSYQLLNRLPRPCTWLVQPNTNISGVIALTVNTLQLPAGGSVHLYQGLANLKTKFVQAFNGSSKLQVTLFVPVAAGLRLDSVSGHSTSNQSNPWLSAYYEVQPECHHTIELAAQRLVNVSNPGYPSWYPLNANCSWQFHIPPKKLVRLAFIDVQLYPSHFLQVYSVQNGTRKPVMRINGSSSVDDVLVPESEVVIEWNSIKTSSHLVEGRGFHIQLEVIDCGGSITSSSSSVITPGYPSSVNESIVCTWIFDVPKKASSSDVNNIEFHFEESHNSNSSRIEFYDGGSISAPLLTSLVASAPNFSRSHKLLVRYVHTDPHGLGAAYKIVTKSHACDPDNQCKLGICMQENWRCNGINDCGDYSDELNCSTPATSGGVAPVWLAVGIIIALLVGIALTLLAPLGLKKLHAARQRYHDFRTLPDA